MSFIEEISWMSKSGYSDRELLEYIDKHFDEIECELNGEVYEKPKKRDHNFCMDCKLRKTIDYQKSTLYELRFMRVLPLLCYIVQSLNATIKKEMHIQKIRQFQSYTKSVPLWWKEACSR